MGQHSDFFDNVREDRGDLARVLKKHKGIRRTVEELYPDSAHFIYELLQNAEDKGATVASFDLRKDRLIFEHNGETFSEADVWGITDIGEGTKATDKEKIGCFGIGFKAVFAYTNSPEVYSPTFSFRIDDLVLPSELVPDSSVGNKTRFVFPFNCEKKPASTAYEEIFAGLNELTEETLLFLTYLNQIHMGSTTLYRVQHSEVHFEVRKFENNRQTASRHFLRFSELVEGLQKQYVRVAFPLQLTKANVQYLKDKPFSEQMQVSGAETGMVAVSFPCVKESSGLRFHIHAPFVPELSRASVKETSANNPLFEQLAKLTAGSLKAIRDLKLLTTDFLAVLPNSKEAIPERYKIFRELIIKAMNTEPLTPTFSRSHAPAKRLFQSRASLKSLLNNDDIAFIHGRDDDTYEWAANASQKNSLQDQFLDSLAIEELGVEEFIEFLESKATDNLWTKPESDFIRWFSEKSDEWLQGLYAVLYVELDQHVVNYQFKDIAIVKLADGSFGKGSMSYFPSEGRQHNGTLPRVCEKTYTSGGSKRQRENAKRFLEAIGVREVGEADEIEAMLKSRYSGQSITPRKSDLKRFVELVESDPKHAKMFQSYPIFERVDGDWVKPSQVYLDSPFRATGLYQYYSKLGIKADRYPLAESYENTGVEKKRIAKFAEAVGALTRLVPTRVCCSANPQWGFLSMVAGERFTSSGTNSDYQIPYLRELIGVKSIEFSRLIWQTMCSLPTSPNYLKATYRMNSANGARTAKSQLVHTLMNHDWIPQNGGAFVKPLDASAELLLDGFPFDSGSAWLKEVEFGCGGQKRDAERLQQRLAAMKLGVPAEAIELIKSNPQEFKRWMSDVQNRIARQTLIDDSESRNRERRRLKLIERKRTAPVRESVQRLRSVQAYSKSEIDRKALLAYYYDEEHESCYCQICLDLMPFVKRSGEECAECVSLFTEKWAELQGIKLKVMTQLYCVLCPVCSEIYRDYVHKDTSKQDELLSYLQKDSESDFLVCGSEVRRDGKKCILHMDATHLGDIRDCLSE